jgi:hypothetical protein
MHAGQQGLGDEGEGNVYRLSSFSILNCCLQRHYQFTADIHPTAITSSAEAPEDRNYTAVVSDSFRSLVSAPSIYHLERP